ncbi:MAG: LytR/AlgR family response regulator transcription factor [Eubacteriaceae bacterium]
MKYTIALCDDQDSILLMLEKYILEFSNEKSVEITVERYQNPQDFVFEIKKVPFKYNIVFLDINMPLMDGIEVGKIIRDYNKQMIIVYITGHDSYALKAFEVRAFHYITKPIEKEKLRGVFLECIQVISQIYGNKYRGTITIKKGGELISISYDDVIYIEKKRNQIRIVCEESIYEYYCSIKRFKNQLNDTVFLQCHQGYIIHKHKITNLNNNYLNLQNKYKIPVSKNNVKKMRRIFFDSLRGENII